MTGAASKRCGLEGCKSPLSRGVYCVAVVLSTGKVGSRFEYTRSHDGQKGIIRKNQIRRENMIYCLEWLMHQVLPFDLFP